MYTFSWHHIGMLVTLFSTSTLLNAEPVQNRYYDELVDMLNEHQNQPPAAPANDYMDKFCLDILRTAAPANTMLIKVTPNILGRLYDFIEKSCAEQKTPIPRIFLSLDDQDIDVKFCTYNLEGGLLIHKKTLQTFSTRVFRGYIQQVLLRMNKHFASHTSKLKSLQNTNNVNTGIALGANVLTFALSQLGDRNNSLSRFFSLLQVGLAGASALWLYREHTKKMSSYSFQRVSSFHNQEQAREDVFPGTSPEESLEPVFNAGPEHALDVIAATQSFIRRRNAEFADLAEWEEEEEMERRQLQIKKSAELDGDEQACSQE